MTLPLAISLGLLAIVVLALLIWLRGDNYDDDPTGDGKR